MVVVAASSGSTVLVACECIEDAFRRFVFFLGLDSKTSSTSGVAVSRLSSGAFSMEGILDLLFFRLGIFLE